MTKIKVISVSENDTVILNEQEAQNIKVVLSQNPNLPLRIDGTRLIFNDYTVGEFRVGNLSLKITPRNQAYDLHHFFKMLQYVDNHELEEIESLGWQNELSDFGVSSLSQEYCSVLDKLIQFGLTGAYRNELELGKTIRGEINTSEYFLELIPMNGISCDVTDYTINIHTNRILKSALTKLIDIEGETKHLGKYQYLRDFDDVDESVLSESDVKEIISQQFSSNPYYPLALEIARKILFSLDLNYTEGNVDWLAFLENSNTIFEEYVRKILDVHLDEDISKWEKAECFAHLTCGEVKDIKSYIPDILLKKTSLSKDYLAVLDAKNKPFELNGNELSKLASSSDIYQLYFYCDMLDTKLGGLVYPAKERVEPISINIDSKCQILRLFSVDMSKPMRDRHFQLVKDIKEHLLSFS